MDNRPLSLDDLNSEEKGRGEEEEEEMNMEMFNMSIGKRGQRLKYNPFLSEEPDLSAIKEKKIGGGRKLGDLALMKEGTTSLDLRKPISIEKQRNFELQQNSTVVIQHKTSE
jgi:hypothetical protein